MTKLFFFSREEREGEEEDTQYGAMSKEGMKNSIMVWRDDLAEAVTATSSD